MRIMGVMRLHATGGPHGFTFPNPALTVKEQRHSRPSKEQYYTQYWVCKHFFSDSDDVVEWEGITEGNRANEGNAFGPQRTRRTSSPLQHNRFPEVSGYFRVPRAFDKFHCNRLWGLSSQLLKHKANLCYPCCVLVPKINDKSSSTIPV
jgi:hypothetical protein